MYPGASTATGYLGTTSILRRTGPFTARQLRVSQAVGSPPPAVQAHAHYLGTMRLLFTSRQSTYVGTCLGTARAAYGWSCFAVSFFSRQQPLEPTTRATWVLSKGSWGTQFPSDQLLLLLSISTTQTSSSHTPSASPPAVEAGVPSLGWRIPT